jgi:hypothetical protein
MPALLPDRPFLAGLRLFARVVRIVSHVADAEEAALLSRQAALKLGFDATQLWIEAERLAAAERRRRSH